MKTNPKLYEYAIIWHPTETQEKEGQKSKIVAAPKVVLSADDKSCLMIASMDIPLEYKDNLDQIELAIRPF